jgi:MFS family permease
MVVATMPRLGHDLGVPPTTAVWLLLAGSAVTGGLMLPIGRWADVSEKRLAFLAGTIGYALAGGLAAASPSVPWLLAARGLQGGFNALLIVVVVTVAVEAAGHRGRAAAIAFLTAVAPFANMTGPPLAALLIPAFGWRSVFVVSIPMCLAAAGVAWIALPATVGVAGPRPRWLLEAGAMTLAVTSLFLLLRQLPDGGRALVPGAGLALLCAIGVATWIRLPQAHGILRLVAARRLSSPLGGLSAMALSAGIIAFAIPFFLLVTVRMSLQIAGIAFIALAFGQTLSSAAGGYALARWGGWPLAIVGAAVMAVGTLLLLPLDSNWGPFDIGWRLATIGIGFGLVGSSNQSTVMGLAPWHHEAAASAVSGVSRTISYALGAALASTITALAPHPLVGLRLAIGAALLACIAAIVAATQARRVMGYLDELDHHPTPHLNHVAVHRLDGLAQDPQHPQYLEPEPIPVHKGSRAGRRGRRL